MNRIAVLFLFVIFFSSCSKNKNTVSKYTTGEINSISLVIDNQLWNGVVGDSLRNKFAAPVEALPDEEPIFDINQYPADVMEGFVTKSRAIIVVKKGLENRFFIQKNPYASPQNVFHITGTSNSAIIQLIEDHSPSIIRIIQKGELEAHQALLRDSVMVYNAIQKRFHLDLKLQKGFESYIENENFVWFKKEFFSGNSSILVTRLPMNSFKPQGDVLNQFVRINDSIGKKYILGNEPNSYKFVDSSFPLYLSQVNIGGRFAFKIKGTWRLKKRFMFGPFVSYLVLDYSTKEIIYLEGFCYVPSQERRNYIHELQAIIEGSEWSNPKAER